MLGSGDGVALELGANGYRPGLCLRLILAGGRPGRHTFAGKFFGIWPLVVLILRGQAEHRQPDAGNEETGTQHRG